MKVKIINTLISFYFTAFPFVKIVCGIVYNSLNIANCFFVANIFDLNVYIPLGYQRESLDESNGNRAY